MRGNEWHTGVSSEETWATPFMDYIGFSKAPNPQIMKKKGGGVSENLQELPAVCSYVNTHSVSDCPVH
jgi:hypothetical protein